MKKLVMFLMASMLIVLAAGCELKENAEMPKLEENVHVYDQEEIMDDSQEEELNTLLNEVEEKTSKRVLVVSIRYLNNSDIDKYSEELYAYLKNKYNDTKELIVIVNKEKGHKAVIKTAETSDDTISNEQKEAILQNTFFNNKDGKYTQVIKNLTCETVKTIAENNNIKIDNFPENQEVQKKEKDFFDSDAWLIISILIGPAMMLVYLCGLLIRG